MPIVANYDFLLLNIVICLVCPEVCPECSHMIRPPVLIRQHRPTPLYLLASLVSKVGSNRQLLSLDSIVQETINSGIKVDVRDEYHRTALYIFIQKVLNFVLHLTRSVCKNDVTP